MADAVVDESKPGRKNQPKCGYGKPEGEGCSHPISFHGGGTSDCKALGCHCPQWIAPTPVGASTPG